MRSSHSVHLDKDDSVEFAAQQVDPTNHWWLDITLRDMDVTFFFEDRDELERFGKGLIDAVAPLQVVQVGPTERQKQIGHDRRGLFDNRGVEARETSDANWAQFHGAMSDKKPLEAAADDEAVEALIDDGVAPAAAEEIAERRRDEEAEDPIDIDDLPF